MATQAQQTQLLTFLVGTFDAAPTAELFTLLEGALDNGATVPQLADVIVGSEYFTGLYADTDAFAANFPAALVGPFVSAEVLTAAEGIVSQWLADGVSVAGVIANALVALSGVDAADETWGAAKAALDNKVTVAQYFVDNVSGASLDVAGMQAILASVTEDAATVTAAQESIDTDFAPANPGETFTLTTGADAFDGTSGDDVFTSAAGTLQATDIISDSTEGDNDTLNITLADDGVQFTANKIENINVTLDNLSGLNASVDATKISGLTTITLNAGKAVDGIGEVLVAGSNNVTAGTGITDLRVTDATVSTIDAGSASKVTVDDTAATTDKITVVANGNLDLTATTGSATDALTIEATAASVVNLNAASTLVGSVTVTGSNDVTLDSGDELTGLTVKDSTTDATVKVDVDAAGALNTAAWTVDSIILSADINNTVTAGSAQTFDVTKSQTALVINSSAATDASATVNTGVDSTSISFNTGSKAATVNVTADAEIGTLDQSGAGGKLVVTGSSELTVGQTNATSLDLSDYTGKTTIKSDAAATASVELGSGVNKLTLANIGYLIAGGSNADTIDGQALAGAVDVVASTGAGNDTFKVNTLGAGTLTFNGGAGTDTLWVKAGGSTTGATAVNLTDVEFVEVENQTAGADTTTITLAGADLNKETLTVKSADAIDTITVNVTATTAGTTDLSGVSLSNIDTFNINGADGSAETIVGTSGADTINGGTGGDTLTGGAGADTFVFDASDSVEATMASITDYTANSDVIDLVTTVLAAAGENNDTVTGFTGVTAVVANGVMTLSGLAADRAAVDTLAEWIDIAEAVQDAGTADGTVLAFEFNGSTYISEYDNDVTTPASLNVIELTGVTGITALSDTGAANTIEIA